MKLFGGRNGKARRRGPNLKSPHPEAAPHSPFLHPPPTSSRQAAEAHRGKGGNIAKVLSTTSKGKFSALRSSTRLALALLVVIAGSTLAPWAKSASSAVVAILDRTLRHRSGGWSGWWSDATSAAFAAIERVQTYDLGNVIAAIVAVGGYLVEHWFSRRTAQVEKQMERVEAQSHDLLVPVTMHWQSLWMGSLLGFVDKHYGDLRVTRDEHKELSLRYQHWLDNMPDHMEVAANLNNPAAFMLLSEVMFNATPTTTGHEMKMSTSTIVGVKKRAKLFHSKVTSNHELPLLLQDRIQSCDREDRLWKSYEAFVRHSLVPAIDRIADVIDEYGHLMEPVPPRRMAEIFGTDGTGYGVKWTVAPRMWFYSMFLAYARSWREVLSAWDDGIYDNIRPAVNFPVGIMFFNVEMQSIVAEVEKELIGASQMHGHQRRGWRG